MYEPNTPHGKSNGRMVSYEQEKNTQLYGLKFYYVNCSTMQVNLCNIYHSKLTWIMTEQSILKVCMLLFCYKLENMGM